MNNKYFSIWCALFVTLHLLFFTFIVWDMNPFTFIIENDKTYISILILIIFEFTSLHIGRQILQLGAVEDMSILYVEEDSLSELVGHQLTSLGLVGTLIGLLIVLLDGFATYDLADAESARIAIQKISIGMGTAMITTLTGIVCSMLITMQLVVLRYAQKY